MKESHTSANIQETHIKQHFWDNLTKMGKRRQGLAARTRQTLTPWCRIIRISPRLPRRPFFHISYLGGNDIRPQMARIRQRTFLTHGSDNGHALPGCWLQETAAPLGHHSRWRQGGTQWQITAECWIHQVCQCLFWIEPAWKVKGFKNIKTLKKWFNFAQLYNDRFTLWSDIF